MDVYKLERRDEVGAPVSKHPLRMWRQVAEEHGLEVSLELPGAGAAAHRPAAAARQEDDLAQRVAELRRG